jgi:F0F1-type ATP synthase beta subunit
MLMFLRKYQVLELNKNMQELIEIFKMENLNKENKIKIIKEIGIFINEQFKNNVSEGLVIELVLALDPENNIKDEPRYKWYLEKN